MILIDFSQISISAITSQLYGTGAVTEDTLDISYVRHLIINTLRSYRQKYYREYGELVVCCDSKKGYWRKDVFPQYKAGRKKDREDSKLDWTHIFNCIDTVRDELVQYFPYPVIRCDDAKAEGDDVVAVLAEWLTENDINPNSMWEDEPNKILIVSADGDLVQLQKFKNVYQYSPMQKKWLKPEGMTVDQFILEHVIEGDSVDGVPNTLSVDNSFVDKIRQKSLTKERRAEFMEKGFEACRTDDERKFFQRNQQLVDFNFIPENVKEAIIEEYRIQKEACDKLGRKRIMSYLIKNKMKLLLDNLSEF